MIKVRVDDFPHTKGEPQHTLEAYRSFHRVLREGTGGRKYLLGVIPGRCSPEHLVFIRNELGESVEVGMHGTDHDEARLDRNGGNQFEPYMTGAGVREQLLWYSDRLDQALGGHVDIYMPPRNVVDRRTLDQLLMCGFMGYTGGPETSQEMWAQHPDGLVYYHSQVPHEYGRSDEMLVRGSASYLRDRVDREGAEVILTLHWTWETNVGLSHLREFLSAVGREHFTDFS